MKKSSIADKVFSVNLNYVRLQNKTKELFFRYLDENRSVDEFKAELTKIWGNVDYSYLESQISEYEAEIHERNTGEKKEDYKQKKDFVKYLPLVAITVIQNVDKKFQNIKLREYSNATNSYSYKNDKEEYLKLKVKKYNDDIVPYELHEYINGKKTDNVIGYRYVQPSTYNAMIQNTNLTRSGWNTTLNDGDDLGQAMFYIPSHSFSCPHCVEHQEIPMTKDEVINLIGVDEEASGDILHPNCKCELTFYERNTRLRPIENKGQLEEEYEIRQKVNTLTLKKERVLTDMKIQKGLGNQDVVDELNNMRNSINKKIRELQSKLPTEELKKQVVAINREKRISSNKYVEQARKNIIKKEQNKTKEKLLKETKRNKEKLNQMKKLSSQTHKEMQELFKIRENRPKYMEQLEKKQQELKEIREIIKQENKDMKYWKSKQQELSLKVDIKNLKDLINK